MLIVLVSSIEVSVSRAVQSRYPNLENSMSQVIHGRPIYAHGSVCSRTNLTDEQRPFSTDSSGSTRDRLQMSQRPDSANGRMVSLLMTENEIPNISDSNNVGWAALC